jgi:hypothetical protein
MAEFRGLPRKKFRGAARRGDRADPAFLMLELFVSRRKKIFRRETQDSNPIPRNSSLKKSGSGLKNQFLSRPLKLRGGNSFSGLIL